MNEFDLKAAGWDENPIHINRAAAIVGAMLDQIPLTGSMTALEFGAGTGIASFLLRDRFRQIVMIDSSAEMVKIMKEKIRKNNAGNLEAKLYDLEKEPWRGKKFDLVMTQMVLHHIADIEDIISKFHNMLTPGGYLAVADLYPEDGSFHGEGFTGHRGFDTGQLSKLLESKGFSHLSAGKCFEIKKQFTDTESKQFDVFLITARRST
jgi:tRNA (cmo5U34)-methyltransferase